MTTPKGPGLIIGIHLTDNTVTVGTLDVNGSLVTTFACDTNTATKYANLIWEAAYKINQMREPKP